jgi:hypothetical protein
VARKRTALQGQAEPIRDDSVQEESVSASEASAPRPAFELAANPPVCTPEPPVAIPIGLSLSELQERLDRLEQSIRSLQEVEQRLANRPSTQIQREPDPVEPASSSVFDAARALVNAGASLLPAMTTASSGGKPARPWLIREILVELQCIYYLYADPRYRLGWIARFVPLILVVAIFTSGLWVPFASVLGILITKPVDVLLSYVLFRVLAHEARRYRETAPDLPPYLRL